MIYTVTFNPALDYAMGVKKLEPGMTNRSYFEQLLPGGKGLNVSAILTHLGIENTALGFIAGFTGKEIKRRFEEAGGHSDFIELKNGVSRINVKIKSDTETEINASGPDIDAGSLDKLMEQLDSASKGDTVVISGSIPAVASRFALQRYPEKARRQRSHVRSGRHSRPSDECALLQTVSCKAQQS